VAAEEQPRGGTCGAKPSKSRLAGAGVRQGRPATAPALSAAVAAARKLAKPAAVRLLHWPPPLAGGGAGAPAAPGTPPPEPPAPLAARAAAAAPAPPPLVAASEVGIGCGELWGPVVDFAVVHEQAEGLATEHSSAAASESDGVALSLGGGVLLHRSPLPGRARASLADDASSPVGGGGSAWQFGVEPLAWYPGSG
jgi:hypothetical protein